MKKLRQNDIFTNILFKIQQTFENKNKKQKQTLTGDQTGFQNRFSNINGKKKTFGIEKNDRGVICNIHIANHNGPNSRKD